MSLSEEAKAIIEEEERILAEVVLSLENERTQLRSRYRIEEERSRDLNAQIVAATRAEDRQMLASDEAVSYRLRDKSHGSLKDLDKLLDKPYFARIVLDEENEDGTTREIEYKIGSRANVDCRIIDWRKAPISKLYYEYGEGEDYDEEILGRERRGVVRIRRKVEISHGQLQRISCSAGDFIRSKGAWEQTTSRMRGKGGAGRLPDILSLITAEQYRAITEDADSAVLIQGVAGSGKTAVALHRISWLLHPDNSDMRPHECATFIKSKALGIYIKNSLESFGYEGVVSHSFGRWCEKVATRLLGEEITRPSSRVHPGYRRVKKSWGLFSVINSVLEQRSARRINQLNTQIDWALLPPALKTLFDKAASESKTFDEFSQAFQSGLVRANQNASISAQFGEELAKVEKLLQSVSAEKVSSKEIVLEALSRTREVVAADDRSLLDESLVEDCYQKTRDAWERGVFDWPDDALLAWVGHLTGEVTLRENGAAPFRHVLVDEVQDFAPIELALIVSVAESPHALTLAGDVLQDLSHGASFVGWQKVREYFGLDSADANFFSLTVSHRSTLPIMRFADAIQGTSRTTGGREGKPPLWYLCRNEDDGVREAISWLKRVNDAFPGSLTAVLCRTSAEARYVQSLLEPTFSSAVRLGDGDAFSFEEGILVTEVRQIKGLEFPHVLLWNPSRENYGADPRSKNLLYVAATRAEDHLCLVTWQPSAKALPSPMSKLVRMMDMRPER